MRRMALLAAMALVAIPAVTAQSEGGPVSFLVYHALGGPDPDPLASALAPPPAGSERLPATFFDGAHRASNAPENAPGSALAHYRELQRLLGAREVEPAGVALVVSGELAPDVLRVEARASDAANVSFILFEHGARLSGAPQPYVARFAADPISVGAGGGSARADIRLDPAWDPARLGVVAIARADGVVLQSATWTVAGDAPVAQTKRAVLVEHVTASWCDPCAPADEAVALLALQRGVAGALPASDVIYLRAPDLSLYAGVALGAVGAVVVLRRARA